MLHPSSSSNPQISHLKIEIPKSLISHHDVDDSGSFHVYSIILFEFSCILESIHVVFMHIHAHALVLVLVLESSFIVFKGFSLSFNLVYIEF